MEILFEDFTLLSYIGNLISFVVEIDVNESGVKWSGKFF